MKTLLAVLVAASQQLYVANVPSYGCTSNEEVAKLQSLRSDQKSFQMELYQQVFQGQCVPINKGQVVQGVVDEKNSSILRVDEQIAPPGYLSPVGDFQLKQADGAKPAAKDGGAPSATANQPDKPSDQKAD